MTQRTDYPKIETWHRRQDGAEGRPLVTTWHATVFEARQARAKALGCDVTDVMGRRVGK